MVAVLLASVALAAPVTWARISAHTVGTMANRRTDMHRLQELIRLHRKGEDKHGIARQLRMSPNTERKYREALLGAGLLNGAADEIPDMEEIKTAIDAACPRRPAPQETSSVARWSGEIEALYEDGLEPQAILDRLRLEKKAEGFTGSYSAVKRFCRRLRNAKGVLADDVSIPVETGPGEVAQIDFGEIARLYDPVHQVLRRAWVFVIVLGHSRHMFAKVVFDQRTETWLQLHIDAFATLGGVPRVLVPDNLKAAVVRAAFGFADDPALNRSYRELARHYDFKVDPTPIYAPKKKGKVESGVKYVKRNALAGRAGEDIDDVNASLEKWTREIAGMRTHGTTGKPPLAVYEEVERQALLALPRVRWDPVTWKKATVHKDVHVSFDRALYSVPWRLTGKEVWIRATATTVAIYADDTRVATHSRGRAGARITVDDHLPEGRRDLRHRSRSYWESRADVLGEEVGRYVREVFDADDVVYQLRAAQAVVTLLEKYPPHRAEAACLRARYFANYTYRGLKQILLQGLDLEPLPVPMSAAPSGQPGFRFARNISELMNSRLEETHEPN